MAKGVVVAADSGTSASSLENHNYGTKEILSIVLRCAQDYRQTPFGPIIMIFYLLTFNL